MIEYFAESDHQDTGSGYALAFESGTLLQDIWLTRVEESRKE